MAEETFEIDDFRSEKGHGWKVFKVDGMWSIITMEGNLKEQAAIERKLISKEMREDDILINAYPKCGTHWLWEISNMILAGKPGYTKQPKEIAMLGIPEFDRSDELPSPRVLNSHLTLRKLPKQIVEKKVKIMNVMRNPKDVVVSFYNHLKNIVPPVGFNGDFDEFLELFQDGRFPFITYFDFIKEWQQVQAEHQELPFLNIFYEDMKKDPVSHVRQVAKFLGKDISGELSEEIAQACSFGNLKQADTKKDRITAHNEMWKDGKTDLYRKGEVGDWKNWFTVAQNERFDEVIQREMAGTGIRFTYE